MKIKNKGIILCLAAMAVLLVILVFQGVHHVPRQETGRSSEGVQTAWTAEEDRHTMAATDGAAGVSGSVMADPISPSASPEPSHTPKEGTVKEAKRAVASAAATASPESGARPGQKKNNAPSGGKKPKPKKTIRPKVTPVRTKKPEKATAQPEEKKKEQISFCIECTRILGHRELWKDGIGEIIPDQGIFYSGECSITGTETVYDVLKRVCREKEIALDSQYTPIYGSYYIRGIGNLYEFDCGSGSGWKYSVNGTIPNEGCSSYPLHHGDKVVFFYDIQV